VLDKVSSRDRMFPVQVFQGRHCRRFHDMIPIAARASSIIIRFLKYKSLETPAC